ncbi:MAG TPA: glycosyltransferase family 2 protein [Chloroflexi bacterium]|nr:glycosyltransferase family 2 protein [Chloroflexota bacterium]
MPQVSIIIPCYNEQATIRLLLDALYAQVFARSEMEVIIADGLSTDGTRAEISAWGIAHPDLIIRIVDNPKRVIPAALNAALRAAEGEIVVRLDAHSMPEHDYVARSVQALREGRGDNVGGVWRIQPGAAGWVARSIAVAAAHPLGVGGAQYRVGGQPQAVDTIPFGAYYRNLIERIGFYDETLLSNEDYEYNARIRRAGGVVWFDPQIQSTYFARSTFGKLAQQYWRYGYWKLQMLRRYPNTIRWRQGLPPAFVLSVFLMSLLAIWFQWAAWLLLLETIFYSLVLAVVGLQSAVRVRNAGLVIGVPLAIASMHISWGVAFLWSFGKTVLRRAG